MDNKEWIHWTGIGRPRSVRAETRIMVVMCGTDQPTLGPYRADMVDWSGVVRYRCVDTTLDSLSAERDALRAQRDDLLTQLESMRASRDQMVTELANNCDELRAELTAVRAGNGSALNLQRLFLATAEVSEARAQREYASSKLEHALLKEQIATAISRGHLPSDFHAKLREWSK